MTASPATDSLFDGLARDLRDGIAVHLPYALFSVVLVCSSVVAGTLSQSLGTGALGRLPFTRLASSILTQDRSIAALIRTDTELLSVLVVGVVTLGAATALGLVAQGVVVGLYVGSSLGAVGPGFLFVSLAPHGLLRLVGLALAAAVSFRLVTRAVAVVAGRRQFLDNTEWRQTGLVVCFAWVTVVLAAVVESVVTVELTRLLF